VGWIIKRLASGVKRDLVRTVGTGHLSMRQFRRAHVERFSERVGDLWCEMDGSLEEGVAVSADQGHWLLDLKKNLVRRAEAMAGRSARFAIFTCEYQ